ncbi:MAG: polyphosphate:AMP phosphotransferase [Burkholderiales bacterium]
MLELAEQRQRLPKSRFERALPRLREELLNAQFALAREACGAVLILLAGIEGGGRSETANTLNAWMDPRHIRTVAFARPTPEERVHPPAWRYWRALPARGTIGILTEAWYDDAQRAQAHGHAARFERMLGDIRDFEMMLACDRVLLLKIWIHLSPKDAATRIEALREDAWRLVPVDRASRHIDTYFSRRAVWEDLLRETSSAAAPWFIVNGFDPQYRALTIGRLVLTALRRASAPPVGHRARPARRVQHRADVDTRTGALRAIDLAPRMPDGEYREALAMWQHRLARHTRRKRFGRHSLILVFEGADAAGKGGTIRRVTGALDARQYVNVPVSAPDDEERRYPWLWRFWRHVPARGGITIFDRSWYGRVLVERVEGFCSVADWQRAYGEISQFEEQLYEGDAILCKFWLQVSKAEQLARFRAREHTPYKHFKITPDDWRNRRRWDDYQQAVADMVERTSTSRAPWSLIGSDDKGHARVEVLKTIVERLDQVLG